ncbi:Ros/MucR family transcriptional regulator [Komagataeibacter medellinensis]|uniref:Transcriptional regulator Ros/MucR family n=1 Tax=Komagataeibacter medellinensis (strain NBRC 3288 / BCRC 11682 / LMG 1693 / Kondo 51) TaxID=634177 RepID=G2I816_KOMMN|nr:MucR family transcriptional regulator [Komagataeibacter medellinensis]BAK86059.1 transcriptional regulator Ros/MucR family [Komagataeibacter medellinensis NBRC 3288]
MDQSDDLSPAIVIAMSDIVAAHLGNTNTSLPTEHVPAFIRDVYAAIRETTPVTEKNSSIPAQHPAVPVAQSVFPDYIVCLEDGKKLKMLKRHLQTRYGMTPTQYREKWQLPMDYPMVAPEYAKMRAALARDAGLGRKILVPPTGPVGEATVVPSVDSATKEISVDTSEAVVPAKKTISKRSRSSATETGSSAASPRKTPGSKTSARPRAIRKTGTKAKGAKV